MCEDWIQLAQNRDLWLRVLGALLTVYWGMGAFGVGPLLGMYREAPGLGSADGRSVCRLSPASPLEDVVVDDQGNVSRIAVYRCRRDCYRRPGLSGMSPCSSCMFRRRPVGHS